MDAPVICTTPDAMMEHYATALFAGDWKGCSDLYEDDAVYYRPNQVLARDRAAIEAHYQGVVERAELLSLERAEGQFTISGDYAFQHGLYVIESRDRETGETRRAESRSTLVLHRGEDGGWRFSVMQGN